METTLLTVGLVCLVAAVVGGGLKILGNELPVLQSRSRQAILGVVGLCLIVGAFWDRIVTGGDHQASGTQGEAAKPTASSDTEAKADDAPAEETVPADKPRAAAEAPNLNSAQRATELGTPNGNPFRNKTQAAQYMLIALGFDVGYPDGLEGQRTTMSLEAFQRQHNLPVSGTADAATLAILKARSDKAFLRLKSGQGGQPSDYQKRWIPALEE